MNIELVQQLKQQQVLAPQMILSMDVLLLTNQELEARIEKEFMENPALEIVERESETPAQKTDERPREGEGLFESIESFQNLPKLDFSNGPRRRSGDGDFNKQEALQNVEGTPPGLRDYLVQQLGLMTLPEGVAELCDFLVNEVDERGYLLHPVAVLREDFAENGQDELFDGALTILRSLDPAGVGAESLEDCLALQLKRDGQEYPLELAILQKHVEDLRQNKIPKIAKELGSTVDDIKDSLELLAMLEPYPGREFSNSPREFIRPDIVVEEHQGEFRVRVHDEDLPPLKISETCKQLLSQHKKDREVSGFLRRKMDSASWLIQAVRQRHSTLKEIAECVVRYQIEFMKNGPQHLRAMKMQTIADLVGVHISTISRAAKGKYMQTPHGIFELKYFFTGGVERADGEVESRRNVYRQISELIENEDRSRPLSDTAIANALRAKGLDIARRTVTKYRDQEGIPPSRLRKEY